MQALILAAGMGKRLGKHTADNTKGMLKIDGKTLIERAIYSLKAQGIKKICIVVGYKSEGIIEAVSKIEGIVPEFVFNKDYETTNNIFSLYLAREYLERDDTILMESDIIFDDKIIQRLKNMPGDVAVVDKYRYWMDGTVVILDNLQNIIEFVDKKDMNAEILDNYFKTVNIYKFTKEFSKKHYIPSIEASIKKNDNKSYYETVLKVLTIDSESRLSALCIGDEKWYEIDDPKDLSVAETMFKRDSMELLKESYGGYWRYPWILDYCYLVNPYFPSKMLVADMKSMMSELISRYPSGMGIQALNAGVLFNVDPDMIVVGNGAAELINTLCDFVGEKVAVCVPTFNEYMRCFVNSEIVKVDTSDDGYTLNEERLRGVLNSVDTLVLISPDNPSGAHLSKEEILRLLDHTKAHGKKIIFDESFIDFAENPYTLLDETILRAYPNLIVIKSISKSYGVPGVRLGIMGCSDKETIKKVRGGMPVWNINSFGEIFLQIVTKYAQQYRTGCEQYRAERSKFRRDLADVKWIEIYDSEANYFMCKLNAKISAKDLSIILLRDYDILIKDLTGKDGIHDDKHFRLAIRNREDNDKLISSLLEIGKSL